jgi:hypothetical protein
VSCGSKRNVRRTALVIAAPSCLCGVQATRAPPFHLARRLKGPLIADGPGMAGIFRVTCGAYVFSGTYGVRSQVRPAGPLAPTACSGGTDGANGLLLTPKEPHPCGNQGHRQLRSRTRIF